MRIDHFTGHWERLSNFSPCRVRLDGVDYPSVEHAYQAAKTLDLQARQRICQCVRVNEVKRLGRHVRLRADWEGVKLLVMADLLWQKFSVEPNRTLLCSTGDAELIEGNWWHDTFWGQCPIGTGQNWLGRMLMMIRDTRQTQNVNITV
jgi:ribA/ribD-fused uncharacterized protein